MKAPHDSPVPERDRVPFWQKVAYGLGGPVEGAASWIPQSNLTPVFNVALGLDPALLAMVLMIWRISDSITDQLMGNISDNIHTRWGRRRPLIVLGAILTGLTMPVIWWMPSGLSEWQMVAWLVVGGIIFYSCFSVWGMPYYSLQLEMSPDYNERTNITAYRAYAQQIILIGGGWILALASQPVFGHLANGKPNLVNGMRFISIALALLTVCLGVLPGIFVRERYYEKETSRQEKERLWPGLKKTLSTGPFLWIIAIVFAKNFGYTLLGSLGFYINAYYICRGNVTEAAVIAGIITTAMVLPNFLAIPVCTWIANRWEKRTLLYVTTTVSLAGSLSTFFFITPLHPWLQIFPALLTAPISVGLWLIVPSMQADVVDYDELVGGKRREGSFSAVFSWTLKATTALGGGLSGLLLNATGFRIGLGDQQPAYVLNNLKLFYICTPLGFLLLCYFCIHRYPLTRERMQEIRAKLEARRGVI